MMMMMIMTPFEPRRLAREPGQALPTATAATARDTRGTEVIGMVGRTVLIPVATTCARSVTIDMCIEMCEHMGTDAQTCVQACV